MSFSIEFDQLESSRLGLLNYLACNGIIGGRVNLENDYYKLYVAAGGHATFVGWLGVLFFHGLIEREHDKGEDWYRITRKGAEFINDFATSDLLNKGFSIHGHGHEVVTDIHAR